MVENLSSKCRAVRGKCGLEISILGCKFMDGQTGVGSLGSGFRAQGKIKLGNPDFMFRSNQRM